MLNQKKIFAVIGAGQIGSRHTEALCKFQNEKEIYVIDPSEKAIQETKDRITTSEKQNIKDEIHFCNDYSILPHKIDFAVIATSAIHRFEALKQLTSAAKVKNLLLEKIVFLNENQWNQAENIISENKINTWVNCPRRMNPAYQLLQKLISLSPHQVQMYVNGSDYGLACNSIHFIDLFAFLTKKTKYEISTEQLHKKIYNSKRPGYIELSGKLLCLFTNDNKLEISCEIRNSKPTFEVQIKTNDFHVTIDEINNSTTILYDKYNQLPDFKYETVFQSSLTHIAAQTILSDNPEICPLTKFDESHKLHGPLINNLTEFYNSLTGQINDYIPIT